MQDKLTFEMEPFGDFTIYDEAEAERTDPCDLTSGPAWQAAWRFGTAIRSQGFLPGRHFLQRICKRVIGERLKLNPASFRDDFFRSPHYRQTTPGKEKVSIAVVNGVPIFYRVGGWSGRHIVLITAYEPGYKLPPNQPVRPPVVREAPECPMCGHRSGVAR